MGKQQQFEVLKGVVRRTLLHKFHLTFSVPHTRECPALEEGRRLFFEFLRPNTTISARNWDSLNPKSYSRDPRSLNPTSCSWDNLPSTVIERNPGEFLKLSSWMASDAVSSSRIVPLFNPVTAGHHHLSRSYSNFFVEFSATLGFSSRPPRAKEISLLASGCKFFSSLADKSNAGNKVDNVTAEGRREGQGGDDGLSASVSGIDNTVKKRKRRKSLIQDAEVLTPQVIDDNTARQILTKNLKKPSGDPSTGDNVLPTKQREAKRKRSIDIMRAFQRNSEASEALSTEIKAPESEAYEKALETLLPEQPRLEAKAQSVSSSANQVTEASKVRKVKIRDDLHNGDARKISADSQSSDVQTTANKQESLSTLTSAVAMDQVKEMELKLESADEDLSKTTCLSTDNEVTAMNNETIVVSAAAASSEYCKTSTGQIDAGSHNIPAEFADPRALYQALADAKGGRAYQGQEKSKLTSILYRFSASGWVSDQALSLYINSKFFPSAASRFRKFFMHRSSPELRSYVVSKCAMNEALRFLFPVFAEFCIHEFQTEINRYRELVNTADMTKPDAWYPFARAIKRKVVYHKGPTNSGKTYNALKKFMEASSGIYCSPLRLLAMEVFDSVNMQGVYCNLHTGQEKKDMPFANHLACTVEMCYLTRQWDVAVIDEIQMMSDEYRGWAWTRAFLGLQADEIHLCGDPSALPLVRNLCQLTGDDLRECEYERFKPLTVAEESLRGDFRNIEAGDCIVAFSRRDIFDIKREVELASKHRCCVVYGALPPETRTQQAKLFNEAENEYTVLVASDAIGMGLNLNIRRVVFFSLDKFDGDSKKPVPPAQVKQIAGRAGRRGSMFPEGVTTTFFTQDLHYLGSSMQQDFEPAKAAGLFPVYEQVELFASQLPNENFAKLLERFAETCRLDGAFFLCRYDNLKRVANMLEKVKGLSLEDRFNFCFAPVNVRDPQSMGALYRYATAFSQKIPVRVEMGVVPSVSARDEFELLDLEARHQVLSMYLWLSQHFPGDLFPQKDQAGEMAQQIAVLLGQSLVQSSRRWSKRKLFQQFRGRPMMGKPNKLRPDWKNDMADPSKEFVCA